MTRRDFVKSVALAIAGVAAASPVLAMPAPAVAVVAPLPLDPPELWHLEVVEPEVIRDLDGFDAAWVSSGQLKLTHHQFFKPGELVECVSEDYQPMTFQTMVQAARIPKRIAGALLALPDGTWVKRSSLWSKQSGRIYAVLQTHWTYYPSITNELII